MFVFDYLKQTDKQLFRMDEVAKISGMHINTIRNWIDDKKLPAMRTLGGHRRVTRSTLVMLGASMNMEG